MNKDRDRRAQTRLRILCSKVAEAVLKDEGHNSQWQRQSRSRWNMSRWRDLTEEEASALEGEGRANLWKQGLWR